jgi:peptidoglycan/xylan/chitin deacetylase (PgdA/CDA1 family)
MKSLLIDAAMLACKPFYGGIGSVQVLHRIIPKSPRRWPENTALELTPEDLDAMLVWMKGRAFDFIALDEIPERLAKPRGRKFVAFTLDDGYRDNLENALPVFEKHNVPFAIHITTALADHTAFAWWYALEGLLGARDGIAFAHGGRAHEYMLSTQAEKLAAFDSIAAMIRGGDLEHHESILAAIFEKAPFDPLETYSRELILDWDEIGKLDAHPLVTIGSHGVHHLTSTRLDDAGLRREFAGSKQILEDRLGHPVRHITYPFGGPNAVGRREFDCARECGYATGYTTRSANLFAAHARHLDCLPRLCVSGNYNALPHLARLDSGLISARANKGRRVVTD